MQRRQGAPAGAVDAGLTRNQRCADFLRNRQGGDQTALGVATNYGALNLYLNFINLFQFLLSLMGSRR